MGFIQAYKMALKSIVANKVRAFLTMLGVIIGVGSVITAVAFAQGSTKSITDTVQGLGSNVIMISISGRNSNRILTYDELKNFANKNKNEISSIAPISNGRGILKAGNKTMDTTTINGTTNEYQKINNIKITKGRFLNTDDIEYRQKVAVVGTAVVNEIFDGIEPLGKNLKVNGQVFKIVGILEETAEGKTQTNDDQIIIPISVSQILLKSAVIRSFTVETSSEKDVANVSQKLYDFLMKIYKDSKTFRITTQAQILSMLGDITKIMMGVLGGIATISLVVGGIGIMNIMLVSVTERTREIGIRKAIGAKRKNILTQFLIEALVVTGLGGILGVTFGLLAIKFIIGTLKLVPEVYSIPWIIISFGISLMIGVIFGMFPAYKASKLNPIEALRFE